MKPDQSLGIDDKYMGSNPTSPAKDPSKLMGRGRKGTALDRWVLSTMEYHFRSGMALSDTELPVAAF
jgi:hypothetical protein